MPLIREAISHLCRVQTGCEVVAQCGDGVTAWDAIEHFQPDAALLELGLPNLSALEVVRRLRTRGSPVRVMIMSIRRDRKTVIDILQAGAAGYILKSGPPEQIGEAFRQLARGGGASRKATHYVVKVELGGVAGVIAPLIGKQPADTHVWIMHGDAPAFVKSEGPLAPEGPIWRIELVSPVFSSAPAR